MDEIFFDEVWEIFDKRRQPHRLSEIQEETISFGPESSSSKPSSDEKHDVYHKLPQISNEQYGKAPIYDVVHGDSSSSQAISPDLEERYHHSFDYDVHHLHYESDIEYIPLHAVIYEEPIYEEVPEFVPPAVVDLHRHGELESLPLETRPIYYEPQERTYGSFSSFSSDESEVYVENLHPQVELPKSDFYIQKDVLVEQPAKSAIYDRPPFYYEPEPDYAEIVHKPPKLPETPPPRRVQPIERLEREPEFAHEAFNIYDTIYKTISEHEHHHERHVPKEEPKVVEKVVEYKEPTYKFPNVRQMAEDYAHKHKHKHHEHIKPPPRLQRLYPDQEFQHTHFEPIKPVTHLHVEPTKPVHVEPVKKKEPLGQRIVRPIEPIRHLRRGTLEFETASDLEYSPIPVRANERFIIPLDVSPFAEEQYVVSESQLATPTESEVSSHHHAGSVKRLSSAFEEPIPFAVQKLKPVPKPEVLPRYQTQKPKTIEQQPQKVVSLQRYRPGTVQSQIFKRKIQETVKINGDEYGVLENQIEKDNYYTAQKHNLVHKHLLNEYTSEDYFLDSYLRTNRWDIPVYLVPNAKQNTPFPLQATRQSRISLGVLLRRKRLSTSAPSGLDRIHLDEARYVYPQQFGQQLSQTSTPVKSPSWKVQSPSRSKSTPFVYTPPRVADFTQDEQGELFKNPAFIKARQHSDAFAWGSIHRQQGRGIASVLDEANRLYSAYEPAQKKHHIEQEHKDEARSEHSSHSFGHLQKRHSAHSTTSGHSSHEHFHRHHQDSPIYDTVHEEEPVYKKHKHHSFLPGHQSTEERKYHHEYDVTYEEQGHLMQSRHSHDHGYRYSHPQDDSSGYEPIPFSVRRVQQEEQQPPQLPSTPPPKSPKSFGQILEDKPISVAERLLTKTPSFERRQRHATTRKYSSASEDKPPVLEGSEQRLSPFGTRKMYTAEKKKWFDEGSEFSTHDIHDEAEEIHRAVNALRHVHPPVESVTDKEEEQENRAELARANLRHVESGSIRRKRLREPSDDPYIRHPSAPDFRLGLYFANHPFLTHLARSPAYRGLSRYYSRMPELIDGGFTMQNGNTTDELLQAVDNEHTRLWDPTSLLEKMYKIDYNPLVEKRNRFRTMEGHLEVPNEENVTVPQIEKPWKPLYFRIKEGRFQWFAAHGADENPDQDILLVGTKITANKDDWTFRIEGGKENANLLVKAPSNVFEKWRMALLSNAASQLIDAYVQPVKPPVPHYTQKIAFIELGSCSVRAGILTNKPSLPQVFFPAVACLAEDTNEVFVGIDALKPEVRQRGRLHRPIEGSDTSSVERFHLNSRVVEAIVWKAIGDLKIDPGQYKILLSISQDVPTSFVGQLLRLLLNSIQFQSATIARQPSLILYSYDVTTGVVVDIGERLHIVPVIDEYIVDSAIVSLPFGAQQIRDTLKKRLQAQNNQIGTAENTPVEHIVLQEIVKQTCYVSTDPSAGSQSSTKQVDLTPYSLGSGFNGRISVDSASHQVVEGLFEPKKWGLEIKGIHHLIHGVIQQSPIDSRRTLYRNIYLAGGTSLLPGLAERLETELSKIAPPSIFVQVLGSPWRFHAAHLGAQVVATSHQFEHCLANKSNVEEYIKQVEADVN